MFVHIRNCNQGDKLLIDMGIHHALTTGLDTWVSAHLSSGVLRRLVLCQPLILQHMHQCGLARIIQPLNKVPARTIDKTVHVQNGK